MSWMRLRVMLTVCCLFAAGGVGTADAHARSPRSGRARARSYSHSPEFGRSSALTAGSLTTDQAADPLGIETVPVPEKPGTEISLTATGNNGPCEAHEPYSAGPPYPNPAGTTPIFADPRLAAGQPCRRSVRL
jgi:hypothetical protein